MNNRNALIAIVSMLMMVTGYSISTADMYKWVDKDGVTRFQDMPPSNISDPTKVEKIIQSDRVSTSYDSPATPPADNSGYKQTIKATPKLKVEIYTTNWCGYCKQAKEYLNSRRISYIEYDVEKDKDALKRKKELSPNGGVPVAVINGKVIRGFSSNTYDLVLKESGWETKK